MKGNILENFQNRLERLEYLLIELSRGARLSTPRLVETLLVTKKIIQTDFNTYILPYVDAVYYDGSAKCYIAKTNFLQTMLLDSKSLATILMLKVKCADKYSPDGLLESANQLFERYDSLLEERIYSHAMVEKLDDYPHRVVLENAINSQSVISCLYNNKERELFPLKILNLEGFWYLVNWDTEYDDIRRYHLKSITNVEVLDEAFEKTPEIDALLEKFDYAINAFFEPFVEPFPVELYIDAKVAKYFERMPINKRQRVMKIYEDGSIDLEVFITDYMEIIPTIQRYIPYVRVIEPLGLREMLIKSISTYKDEY